MHKKKNMYMKNLTELISSFATKMDDILGSVIGWLMTSMCFVLNYFAGEKICFVAVLTCVIMDAVAGIWSAILQKKYARSELLRDTCSKIFAYVGSLVVVILMGRLVRIDSGITTGIVSAIICACELWSMSASFLIINPKLIFFRLIRPALVGEMARKLGITEEQVESALDNNEELIKK